MENKENIEKQIRTLKGIRKMLDMNRTEFSKIYGDSFKNIRRVGGRKKKNAGLCSQINCILCEDATGIERKRNRTGGRA